MRYKISEDKLQVKVEQNLNLNTKHSIEELANGVNQIEIDLSETRIVDSEGIILLYNLIQQGKTITINSPPNIFFKVIEALKMDKLLNEMTIFKRNKN